MTARGKKNMAETDGNPGIIQPRPGRVRVAHPIPKPLIRSSANFIKATAED
jgi:hypothetical protein